MQEYFIHYLWQMQYFLKNELTTADGESLEILHPGTSNSNSGPDFLHARIRIGQMSWVGHVEVHTLSSHWSQHRHQHDTAYANVVLHVVWRDDRPAIRCDGTQIPTLELSQRVPREMILSYRQLIGSSFQIPCQRRLHEVPEVTRQAMMQRVLIERIERKSNEITELWKSGGNDWEECLHQILFRSFGFKVNAEAFYRLATRATSRLVRRHVGMPLQVEALLFGLAGFLHTRTGDAYYQSLHREYAFLRKKHQLGRKEMSGAEWNFLRMRPANFPTLRLAQLAALLSREPRLFSRLLEARHWTDFKALFSSVPSAYWRSHYHFSKEAPEGEHEIGKDGVANLIINTVVPLLAAYGLAHDDTRRFDQAIQLLESLPPEDNRINRSWQERGISAISAADSQSLLELFSQYCKPHRCLSCSVGAWLVKPATV